MASPALPSEAAIRKTAKVITLSSRIFPLKCFDQIEGLIDYVFRSHIHYSNDVAHSISLTGGAHFAPKSIYTSWWADERRARKPSLPAAAAPTDRQSP